MQCNTIVQRLRFSQEQIYDVVADVESYPQFVPWCKKSIVTHRRPGLVRADLSIGFPPIAEHYTSTVTLDRPRLVKVGTTKMSSVFLQWCFQIRCIDPLNHCNKIAVTNKYLGLPALPPTGSRIFLLWRVKKLDKTLILSQYNEGGGGRVSSRPRFWLKIEKSPTLGHLKSGNPTSIVGIFSQCAQMVGCSSIWKQLGNSVLVCPIIQRRAR